MFFYEKENLPLFEIENFTVFGPLALCNLTSILCKPLVFCIVRALELFYFFKKPLASKSHFLPFRVQRRILQS